MTLLSEQAFTEVASSLAEAVHASSESETLEILTTATSMKAVGEKSSTEPASSALPTAENSLKAAKYMATEF